MKYAKVSIEQKHTKKTPLLIVDSLIKILHPLTPFLTEKLFQMIKVHFTDQKESILDSKLPVIYEIDFDPEDNVLFELYKDVIKTIRSVKGEFKQSKNDNIDISLCSENRQLIKYIQETEEPIKQLAGVNSIIYDTMSGRTIVNENTHFAVHFQVDDSFDMSFKIGDYKRSTANNNKTIEKYKKYLENNKISKKKGIKFQRVIDNLLVKYVQIEKEVEYYAFL
jgi:valyl-tRNA synthetase